VALTNALIAVDDITTRLGVSDFDDTDTLESAIQSASDAIYVYTGQQFWKTTTASARTYTPSSARCALIDPFHTTTDLVIKTDDNDDGTFETTWTTTEYELDQFGGDMANLMSSPYDSICSLGVRLFPVTGNRRRTLQVTAQWGWTAIPSNVTEACKILAVDLWKRKDVAFGIQTGTVDFGGLRIGRDVMAQVASLLAPFRRVDRVIGFA